MGSKRLNTLVKISVLGAISFILYYLIEVPLPIFPDFLKLDISDVPAIFGAFALGPAAAVAVELIKNILHAILKPGTMGIGELANFIVGAGYVFAAGFIYVHRKDKKHAIYGLIAGTIFMAIVAAIGNYFVFLPLYETVLHYPVSEVIKAANKVNSSVTDLNSLIILTMVPFNLLKGAVISVITLVSYKKLSPILHK